MQSAYSLGRLLGSRLKAVLTLAAETAAEHLHWNTEYIVYGYQPMPKKDHRVENGKLIQQDVPNKRHGCITSFKGLDERGKYLLELRKKEMNDTESVLFSGFVDNMSVRMESAPELRVDHTEQELVGVDALWWW